MHQKSQVAAQSPDGGSKGGAAPGACPEPRRRGGGLGDPRKPSRVGGWDKTLEMAGSDCFLVQSPLTERGLEPALPAPDRSESLAEGVRAPF